jgi:hypothetical protein
MNRSRNESAKYNMRLLYCFPYCTIAIYLFILIGVRLSSRYFMLELVPKSHFLCDSGVEIVVLNWFLSAFIGTLLDLFNFYGKIDFEIFLNFVANCQIN